MILVSPLSVVFRLRSSWHRNQNEQRKPLIFQQICGILENALLKLVMSITIQESWFVITKRLDKLNLCYKGIKSYIINAL